MRTYLVGQKALRQHLADVGHQDEIQRLMFTWDWLSLGLCLGWAPADFADELHLARDTVTPWPFTDDQVSFVCEGRRLTKRATSEHQLHRHLDQAERVDLRFDLTRAPSDAP